MNFNLNYFKENIRNKKVAILGIGVSNIPLIKYLSNLGVDITAFDKAEEQALKTTLDTLKGYNIKYSLGKEYLNSLKGFDVIFRTPGMRFDIPEIVEEEKRGAKITSEMEVFFELCPAQIFGVTGSDGKTTTTTIIYNLLKEEGYSCWLGGNIGKPLLSHIDEIKPDDKVVLELSSFQLQTMKKSPSVSVITNLSPNHLDVHKSMEEYVEAKKNILNYQINNSDETNKQKIILNFDNEITRSFVEDAISQVVLFSRRNALDAGVFIQDGKILYRDTDKTLELLEQSDILLPGIHNVENYLAAIAAVFDYVKKETIQKVAKTFTGVEHRIEFVREINGIKFYNDSIASSPSRTIAGLNSFNQKLILISGGADKKIPYDAIGEPIIDKVKTLVLIGQTTEKIEEAVNKARERAGKGYEIEIIKCSTYDEAVQSAYSKGEKGDIVILSPASTSFDLFKNFEHRGNVFKEIVWKL